MKERRTIITRNDLLWMYINLRFDELYYTKIQYFAAFLVISIQAETMCWKSIRTKIYFLLYASHDAREESPPSANISSRIIPRNFFPRSINGIVTGNRFDGSEKERHSAIEFLDQNLTGPVRLSIRLRPIISNAANALFSIGLIPEQRISVSRLRF